MKSPRVRRLTFELLERKASPSALLLALAPLEEPAQRVIESELAMYAAATVAVSEPSAANVALMEFIEQNTRDCTDDGAAMPLPTPAEAAAADTMMTVTDTDLRSMLITEMLNTGPADSENVFSVIQY